MRESKTASVWHSVFVRERNLERERLRKKVRVGENARGRDKTNERAEGGGGEVSNGVCGIVLTCSV